MQSPKEQYLKLTRMDKEPPLLELKGSRFTIIATLLFCSLALCFVFSFILLLGSKVGWDFVKHWYLLIMLFPLIPIFIMVVVVFSVFRFYPNRIEKYCDIWERRFWEKTVYFKDAKISMVSYPLNFYKRSGTLFVLPKGSNFGGIRCNFYFVGGIPAREKVIEFFKSVGIEFVDNNYFIIRHFKQKENTN